MCRVEVCGMSPIHRLVVCLCSAVVLLTAPGRSLAQQNLFNVPNGQITKPGEMFFQQQFNFTRPNGTSNTTFDFGLGNGWEVGFNFLDLELYRPTSDPADTGRQQVNPDVLFNVQKGFEVTEFCDLSMGGQFGWNPSIRHQERRFLNYSWVINQFKVPDREELGKWYLGLYSANLAYAGPGDRVGILMGGEIPIIKDRLSFQFDWTGGRNDLGVAVIGGVYTFSSGWQLSVGAQVPVPRSRNDYGLVMELTCPGFELSRLRPRRE